MYVTDPKLTSEQENLPVLSLQEDPTERFVSNPRDCLDSKKQYNKDGKVTEFYECNFRYEA